MGTRVRESFCVRRRAWNWPAESWISIRWTISRGRGRSLTSEVDSSDLLEGEEELFQQVGGYGSAILGGAADVVNRADFSEDGGASGRDALWGKGLAGQGLFGRG